MPTGDAIACSGVDAGNFSSSNRLNIYGGRVASTRLVVVVVGGGIGGLAAALCLAHAGHSVTVFEAERKLRECGAGQQLYPNMTRLLLRWGMGERLQECAVEPEALVFRRYTDGDIVGRTRWGSLAAAEFGAPSYHVHHTDLYLILLERLQACPHVSFRFNSRVQSLDTCPDVVDKVHISLVNGDVFEADLIVGADGLHGLSRRIVVGRTDLAQRTGDAIYRAVIPTDAMLRDKDLRSLVEKPELTTWMGPRRHIVAHCIRANREYSMMMLHPDHGAEESYTAEGNVDKMREDFADFDIRVRKLLALVDRTLVWRLDERRPLSTWLHSSGRLVLLGDACHPMLPYRAQGAAMAIEDAAVLGNLLSRLGPSHCSAVHLVMLLKAYERMRIGRKALTQETGALNKYIFHLSDGPEQAARDASMRRAMHAEKAQEAAEMAAASAAPTLGSDARSAGSGGSGGFPRPRNAKNANQWADQKKNREQYGYDADADVERWWASEGEAQLQGLLEGSGLESGSLGRSTIENLESQKTGSGKKGFWRKVLWKKGEELRE